MSTAKRALSNVTLTLVGAAYIALAGGTAEATPVQVPPPWGGPPFNVPNTEYPSYLNDSTDWGIPGVGRGVVSWNDTYHAWGFKVTFSGTGGIATNTSWTNCFGEPTIMCSPSGRPWIEKLVSPLSILFVSPDPIYSDLYYGRAW